MQRHQQIVEQVRAGSSLVAAARAFGISQERARQICERAGVRSVCRSYAESAEWRAERNLTIIERVKAGASLVAVSRELGLSPSLVRLVCHQAGVKAQRPDPENSWMRRWRSVINRSSNKFEQAVRW